MRSTAKMTNIETPELAHSRMGRAFLTDIIPLDIRLTTIKVRADML